MTEQHPTYKTDKCVICGTPVKVLSSGDVAEGTKFVQPLYVSDRDRSRLVLELETEREARLALQAEADKCRALLDGAAIEHSGCTLSERVKRLVEREHGYFELGISATGTRNVATRQRDSARKWAARWKRVATVEHHDSDLSQRSLNVATRQIVLLRETRDEHVRNLGRLARENGEMKQQRDSARKWAARWKRCAKRALYGDTDVVFTKPTPGRRITSVVVSSRVRSPLIIEELEVAP